MDQIIHVFEQAGLGKAPFKFIGAIEGNAGCALCGQGIKTICIIQSSDGKTFSVGCDCVEKTGDAGLRNITKQKVNFLKTQIRHTKEQKQIEELSILLSNENNITFLKTLKDTSYYGQKENRTIYDYCIWMKDHAGNSGRIKMLKWLKTLEGIK